MNRRDLFRLAFGTAALALAPDPMRRFFIIGQPERHLLPTAPVILSGGWLRDGQIVAFIAANAPGRVTRGRPVPIVATGVWELERRLPSRLVVGFRPPP